MFLTIRPGRGSASVMFSYGGVRLSRTPNRPYVFRSATAPCGYRLQIGAGPPPLSGGTAGDVSRVAWCVRLTSEVTGSGAMRLVGPGDVCAVPHHFGVRRPMLYGRCPESGIRRKVTTSFHLAMGRNLTRAVKATRPGPLVCMTGATR